ncbi:hypothetical protein [Acinetobacter guillouiae]|uniref:hypothetical protein n=1 Tax=Acinetobacter guillouiae TaxID=106649 RepID=UPI0026E20376|nr:hypothetical protein [Acinetobacter guillouiae]MDO6644546.1 hypothetical protein [Acinetobacter guillouiae]
MTEIEKLEQEIKFLNTTIDRILSRNSAQEVIEQRLQRHEQTMKEIMDDNPNYTEDHSTIKFMLGAISAYKEISEYLKNHASVVVNLPETVVKSLGEVA